MNRQILTPDQLSAALKTLDGWAAEAVSTASDSDRGPRPSVLKKHYTFPDFAAALAYVNQVGALAEAADHHPDITFGWGYAEIALTTHDHGGITDVDIALATNIDALS